MNILASALMIGACAGGQVAGGEDLGPPVSDLGPQDFGDSAPDSDGPDDSPDLNTDFQPPSPDSTMDAGFDFAKDVEIDAPLVDATSDAASDSSLDIPGDLPIDLPPDTSFDLPVDLTTDFTADLGPDLTFDAIPDSVSDSAIDMVDAAPVAEICDNGQDDDLDGWIDCADSDCGVVSPCLSTNRTLVIHEVFPGTIDYLSLRNASTSPRNIADYSLTLIGLSEVSYVLPSRTLSPGEVVHIFENNQGNLALGDIQTGANIPFYDALTTQSNAVILRNPADEVIDYVGLGLGLEGLAQLDGGTQVPAPVSYVGFDLATQAHYRTAISGVHPLFLASDWHVGPKSR